MGLALTKRSICVVSRGQAEQVVTKFIRVVTPSTEEAASALSLKHLTDSLGFHRICPARDVPR